MNHPRLVLATVSLSTSLLFACSDNGPTGTSGSTGGKSTSTGGAAGGQSGSGGAKPGGAGGNTTGTGGAAGAKSTGGTTTVADAAIASDAAGAVDGGSSDGGGASGIDGGGKLEFPMLKALALFTAPGIPEKGPDESKDIPLPRPTTTIPAGLPGKGLAQHPMIYFGETYRRILVVNDGKVIWHYDTVDEWEIDDIWMLSNGNVLFAHMRYIEEITPDKKVVLHLDNKGGEIHTVQPIGFDKVLYVESIAPKAHVKLYNKTTKTYEIDQAVDALDGATHTQCRRFRMTGRGTYIAASLTKGIVYELDKDFKEIYSYKVGNPWSGVGLKNGNVLIQSEGARICSEVNLKTGTVVWSAAQKDVLPAGMNMGNPQTCERLYTGNTVLLANGVDNKNVQAIEVTPENKVVWILQDWMNLGDATSAQFLDEPGYPEVPGDTNH